ncbi:MAG: adenosyl-hopene transferase HpnH, partial [Chloroflexota bacterium]|nr:adenosyl-hopene transferase HpnH [Dehalococcoidia bacterium]MDW8047354.1 adenosyl-hopene transferase HpnH [Chloroflexota bacterium]
HPDHILDMRLTPEECWAAAEECGAPVVSIAGGEPLIHPEIDRIVEGLVERKKYVYLCTNAILLERWLPKLKPSKYLTISVHLDGLRELHDAMVDRKGVFDKAVAGIREAKRRGFRVSTNTTVYADSSPDQMRELFNFLMDDLRVDGMMVSPGYDYPKAPNQSVFLRRPEMIATFRKILSFPEAKRWRFFHTPAFLEFLQGKRAMQCTAWGNPTRTVLGWQRPCYLISDGYVKSFAELIDDTEWDRYGYGRDARCTNCMAHCGYEATAVRETIASPLEGIRAAISTIGARESHA